MKTKLLLILIFIPLIGNAQSTFWSESFETDGNGSRYTPEVEVSPTGSGASCNDYFFRNIPSDGCTGSQTDITAGVYTGFNGSYIWSSEDHDDGGVGGSGNFELSITFDNIPTVSGKSNLAFRGLFGAGNTTAYDNNTAAPSNPDFMIVEYQIDGGGYQSLLSFHPELTIAGLFNTDMAQDTNGDGYGNGTKLTNNLQEFVGLIPTTGSTLDLRIRLSVNSGNEELAFDHFELIEDFSLTWNGNTNNDWFTADNWTPATVPGSGSDVTIPTGLTNYPTAGSAVTVNSVSIASGATLIANSTFAGTVTYNRNLGTTNWYLVSTPVSGETMTDMRSNNSFASGSGGSRIGFAKYTSSSDAWSYFTTSSSDALVDGKGYSTSLSSSGDIAYTGTLNTSDVNIAMATGGAGAFNLLGNPFTSHMNSATLLTANSANLVSQTLWLWNQSSGMYETKVTADSFILAPGQGFFVSAANTNNFVFAQSNQSHSGSDTFQRSNSTRPEVHLLMSDGTSDRFAKVYYIDGTTTGFDNGYDGEAFDGQSNSLDVYTHLVSDSQGKNYQIQSLPDTNFEDMIVPVGVKSDAGTVTFTTKNYNLPSGYKVFLEDKQIGNFIKLDEDGSKYDVTFDSPVEGIGRFFLHTTTNALSTGTIDLNKISAYMSDKRNLRIIGIESGTTRVGVYSILGKQVMNASIKSNGVDNVTLPNLKQGVYIVEIVSGQGTINKKIIIE